MCDLELEQRIEYSHVLIRCCTHLHPYRPSMVYVYDAIYTKVLHVYHEVRQSHLLTLPVLGSQTCLCDIGCKS